MGRTHANERPSQGGEIVDFDAVMLQALAPEVRAELMREAELLAGVFAPGGAAGELREMARQLSRGVRDAEMPRVQARRLAAALRRLADPPPAGSQGA